MVDTPDMTEPSDGGLMVCFADHLTNKEIESVMETFQKKLEKKTSDGDRPCLCPKTSGEGSGPKKRTTKKKSKLHSCIKELSV